MITALAPWYGANRMGASKVGEHLFGCDWVGIPFAGGMAELLYVSANTILVNDRHNHVINLAAVVSNEQLKNKLIVELDGKPFHPHVLRESQWRCNTQWANENFGKPNYDWAFDYFVCAWMARNGIAGTDREFKGELSVRYEGSGGDSAIRFRNATKELHSWHKIMQPCTFSTDDCFDFFLKCKDRKGSGIYSDAPWPEDGDKYKYKFNEEKQYRLATVLMGFTKAKVVVRFGDHPLIRKLYPESEWNWFPISGRTSANKEKSEVLLVKRCS